MVLLVGANALDAPNVCGSPAREDHGRKGEAGGDEKTSPVAVDRCPVSGYQTT
jgi:hypothetical protein